MKKILILISLFSLQIFSQDISNHSFYEFKETAISNINQTDFTSNQTIIDEEIKTKKSAGQAILYSLLLPGMGELYAEGYDSGIYFTIADGVLWGVFIGMNVYGNWQQDRYISYAQSNAGISTSGKDENYYATISEYSDIEKYNDEKAFERNYAEMYDEQKYFWKWSSTEQRKTYRDMWVSSEQTLNDVQFVVGALILNRIISAINATRLVSKYNSNLKTESSWNVSVGVNSNINLPTSLNINFQQKF
jgi:hypothetical protein